MNAERTEPLSRVEMLAVRDAVSDFLARDLAVNVRGLSASLQGVEAALSMHLQQPSGYVPCGCRDCFAIAIGYPGELCDACTQSECLAGADCEAPHAYCGAESAVPDLVNDACGACGLPW